MINPILTAIQFKRSEQSQRSRKSRDQGSLGCQGAMRSTWSTKSRIRSAEPIIFPNLAQRPAEDVQPRIILDSRALLDPHVGHQAKTYDQLKLINFPSLNHCGLHYRPPPSRLFRSNKYNICSFQFFPVNMNR